MKKSHYKAKIFFSIFLFVSSANLSFGKTVDESDHHFNNKYDKSEFDIENTDLSKNNEFFQSSNFLKEFTLPAMNIAGEGLDTIKFEEAFENVTKDEALNEENLMNLPIGITRSFGGVETQLVVVNAYFLTDYIMLDILAKVTWKGKTANGKSIDRTLRLGAWNVKYYYKFGFKGDAKLVLLQDVQIPINNDGTNLILAGEFKRNSGEVDYSHSTYLSFGCNGIESLEGHFIGTVSIQGNENCKIKPAKIDKDDFTVTDGLLSVDFETTCSLNDFYFSTSLGLFTIEGTDLFFDVKEITVDLSTVKSHPKLVSDIGILWEGFYIDEFTVYMPKSFEKQENGKKERVSATANNLMIDEFGLSGEFLARNLTTLKNGVAGNWSFAIDSLGFELQSGDLISLGFAGEFRPPVLSDTSSIGFITTFDLATKKYGIKLEIINGKPLGLDVFFADLTIGGGELNITKRENQDDLFELMLSQGSFALKGDKLSNLGIEFNEFMISNAPAISIKTVSPDQNAGKKGSLSNFPITLKEFTFINNQLKLGINVNLMEEKIAGDLNAIIYTKQEEVNGRQKWQYNGIKIEDIGVKAGFDKFSLEGKISMFETEEMKGFSGKLNVGLQLADDSIGIQASATFGTAFGEPDDYRFWHVDMFARGFKVPLFTGVDMTGIGGGAANHMINVGAEFEPDPDMGLFFRVNTELLLAGSGTNNPSQVALEMQFLPNWSLLYVQLFGEVNLAPSIESIPGAEALMSGYKNLASKSGDIQKKIIEAKLGPDSTLTLLPSDFSDRFPVNLDSTAAEVKIQMILKMDFRNKIFTGNASTFINAGNFLFGNQSVKTGKEESGYAGSVYMVFSKDEWFVHAGYKYYGLDGSNLPNALNHAVIKKFEPLGIQLKAGELKLGSIAAYLLIGHHIPELPYPNKDLGISGFPDNILDKYGSVKRGSGDTNLEGAGLAFGAAAQFDIPRIEFLILYAELHAYMGFDVLLKHYKACICDGWEKPFGLKNWYAQGQAYAGLGADIGVYVKLFGKTKQIPAIKANMDILLQAKLPNPTWFSGTLSGVYSVLGGAVSGDFDMNCTFGDSCGNINQQKSEEIPEIQVVNKVWPTEETKMSPVDMPIVYYNYEFNTAFSIDENSAGEFRYMLVVDSITGKYNDDETELKLKPWWSTTKKMYIDFENPDEIWEGDKTVTVTVNYSMMEKINNNWVVATETVDSITTEIKGSEVLIFKTGGEPTTMGLNGIVDMYPAVDQDYFYKGATSDAYIQINSNLNFLFLNKNGQTKKISATIYNENSSHTANCGFIKNVTSSTVKYSLPELENNKSYFVDLFTVNNNIKTKILSFEFHTSLFNTFEEKVATMGSVLSRPDCSTSQIPFSYAFEEPFGQEEIIGNKYMNGGKPLVTATIDPSQNNPDDFTYSMLHFIYGSANNDYPNFYPETIENIAETKVYSTNWGIMEHEMESESMFPFVFTTFNLIMSDFSELSENLTSICDSYFTNYEELKPIVDKYESKVNKCQYNLPLTETQYSFPLNLTYAMDNAGVNMSKEIDITFNR